MDDVDDVERGQEVLRLACLAAKDAYVPVEVLLLASMAAGIARELTGLAEGERIKPDDAVVVGYLLGRCDGDPEKLREIINGFRTQE